MSAFGYFGSKRRIAAKLCHKLPPHNAWVELFCGSAAMTLAKTPAQIEIINDINSDIVNFYKQLRNQGEKLRKLIELTPYSRQELKLARNSTDKPPDLERARRFFITAMMAINGSFGDAPGGFSISNSYSRNGMEARVNRWRGMNAYLEQVIERLSKVRIEQQDALKLFQEYKNRPATLVYFDPPYFADRVQGYDHEQYGRDFHEKLLKEIIEARCMVFISGYENDLYNKLLTKKRGWLKEIISATTKGNNGKSFQRKEVVWFNAVYCRAQRLNRVPVALSKKEKKDRKVNPLRRQKT